MSQNDETTAPESAPEPVAHSFNNQQADSDESSDEGSGRIQVNNYLLELLRQMGLQPQQKQPPPPPSQRVLPETTLEAVCNLIKEGKCKNIIVMTGAGLSCAAGIPDFRSPGTGLYSKLEQYNLPTPESIFTLDFFRENPVPFYTLAKELYPGNYKPTNAHYFITLLHKKGILLRNYSQNIDTLERLAGLPDDKVIEAHGSFSNAHCLSCGKEHSPDSIKATIFASDIPVCECDGLIKPDIVFFGESLPDRFMIQRKIDFPLCDLLIVMGTSLTVYPFAGLVDLPGADVPRLLVNREKVGGGKFETDPEYNYRDVMALGDLQDTAMAMLKLLDWEEDFVNLVASLTTEESA